LSPRSGTHTAVEKGHQPTMNSDPLSEDYLHWLASQIRGEDDGHPDRTYEGLCTIMYETEFIFLPHVPNDNNRIGDGLDLRVEFCHEMDIPLGDAGRFLHKTVPVPPCSFIEVLIGLSRRLAFIAGGRAEGWAWELMNNLVLHRITDPVGRSKARQAKDILESCIWRNYAPDGRGGFFPLKQPYEDQTQVELWYQMAAYVNEIYPEG
jgi:hypothetical protein